MGSRGAHAVSASCSFQELCTWGPRAPSRCTQRGAASASGDNRVTLCPLQLCRSISRARTPGQLGSRRLQRAVCSHSTPGLRCTAPWQTTCTSRESQPCLDAGPQGSISAPTRPVTAVGSGGVGAAQLTGMHKGSAGHTGLEPSATASRCKPLPSRGAQEHLWLTERWPLHPSLSGGAWKTFQKFPWVLFISKFRAVSCRLWSPTQPSVPTSGFCI